MAGDGEFLGVNLFGDGQREVVPFPTTTLLMRRYGVMDLCFYAVFCEILLQLVAMLAKDGEDMPHTISIRLGNPDLWILHLTNISGGNLLAAQVVGIEMPQFYAEHGGLQLIDARVAPLIVVYILLRTAVIAQGADDGCKLPRAPRFLPG